jgi:peptidoglycan/LPS O-acetylase OafA/YrhL
LTPRRTLRKLVEPLRKLERKPELDALRGLFLVWMTLTHLPTHMSDFVNQPFGFVSSAEGFVFLSALLVARLYIRKAAEDEGALRAKLFKRAFRIYGYHVILLAMAFTIAAAFAVLTHRTALTNLLTFYLAHPFTAIVGSLLLIYCPPLLDILPMYVIFLLISPYVLAIAARRGWNLLLTISGYIWLLAQFGLRSWVHALVVSITHLQIPLQETGAFNLFAWQAVWILGMWIGAESAFDPVPGTASVSISKDGSPVRGLPFRRLPAYAYPLSVAVCLFFFAIRHDWLGAALSQERFGLLLDKWQIGALRAVNLVASCSSSHFSLSARPRSRSSAPTLSSSSSASPFSTARSASSTASPRWASSSSPSPASSSSHSARSDASAPRPAQAALPIRTISSSGPPSQPLLHSPPPEQSTVPLPSRGR